MSAVSHSAPAARDAGPQSNAAIAAAFVEVADLLEEQGANPFRVRAYRTAAQTLQALIPPAAELLEHEGHERLLALPGIGQSLAQSIAHLVHEVRLPLLERLRGEHTAEHLFATVADIGPKLASRIHEALGIETLSELAAAARDGRLARVPGMGPKRLQAVRESLAGRFSTSKAGSAPSVEPARFASDTAPAPIAELLDIDREYRESARRGRLPRIAPRRFNPTGEAWLPVLHTQRDDRHYTALFSNTARAHELGTTHDWVVIYRDDGDHHGRWTAITAHFGRLHDRRVIRGHERECEDYYDACGAPDTTDASHRPTQRRLF